MKTFQFASKHSVEDLDCCRDYQETGASKEQNESKNFHVLALFCCLTALVDVCGDEVVVNILVYVVRLAAFVLRQRW